MSNGTFTIQVSLPDSSELPTVIDVDIDLASLAEALSTYLTSAAPQINLCAVGQGVGVSAASLDSWLANAQSVVLTGSEYLGIGGINDPNLWSFGAAPVPGSKVYYLPPAVVMADGEIVATVNPSSSRVGFHDALGKWHEATVNFTTGFVAYGDARAVSQSSLN